MSDYPEDLSLANDLLIDGAPDGFGEICLSFWKDSAPIRVDDIPTIIEHLQAVHKAHKENTND